METEVEEYLRRRYEDVIAKVVHMSKEDLRMVCTLGGRESNSSQTIYWGIDGRSFSCSLRMFLICWLCDAIYSLLRMPIARKWMPWTYILKSFSTLYFDSPDDRSSLQFDDDIEESFASRPALDAIEHIIDAREWDVPYHIRVAIDKGYL